MKKNKRIWSRENPPKKCVTCGSFFTKSSRAETERTAACSRACADHTKTIARNMERRGEKHPFFKKDRSQAKYERLKPEMNRMREIVFSRDGHKCVICGTSDDIMVDHIKQYKYYKELRYDPDNGRTMCHPCHKKTKTYALTEKMLKIEKMVPEIISFYNSNKTTRKVVALRFGLSESTIRRIVLGFYRPPSGY